MKTERRISLVDFRMKDENLFTFEMLTMIFSLISLFFYQQKKEANTAIFMKQNKKPKWRKQKIKYFRWKIEIKNN